MPNDHDNRGGFVEALSWMGSPPFPLQLYVICSHANELLGETFAVYWPDLTDFVFFRLCGDDWPFEIALFEIRVQQLDSSVDDCIMRTLDSVVTRLATACVFMFEGAFYNYHSLFTPDCQSSVFGLCVPQLPPLVCTIDEERKSQRLADYLRLARSWLVEKYPEIKSNNKSNGAGFFD